MRTFLRLVALIALPSLALAAKPIRLSPGLELNLDQEKSWNEVKDHGALGMNSRMFKNLSEDWKVYHRYELKPLPESKKNDAQTFLEPCQIAKDFRPGSGNSIQKAPPPWVGCQIVGKDAAQIVLWIAAKTRHSNVFEVHTFYFPSPPANEDQRIRFIGMLHRRPQ